MNSKTVLSKPITTENGEAEFQVRMVTHEGIGLLTSRSDKNYLILDSLDYWFDVIQTGYPSKKKCSCKNEWFTARFDYIPRMDSEDFREVKIIFTCTGCHKASRAISIEIDYSPTDHLWSQPITYCAIPNLKYKFSELTGYWQAQDQTAFLNFMFNTLHLNVYCWFSQHPDHIRRFEKVTFEKAIQIITINHQHLGFYFTAGEIDPQKMIAVKNERGVFLKRDIWRRNEIIYLSAPFVIAGYGLLYYINYCNQYLDKGMVKDKSTSFEELTTNMKRWLSENFVTKRGANQFDGKEAYDKLMLKK
jgi:hypothetical protein